MDECVVFAESGGGGGGGCSIKGFWPLMLTSLPLGVKVWVVDNITWDSLLDLGPKREGGKENYMEFSASDDGGGDEREERGALLKLYVFEIILVCHSFFCSLHYIHRLDTLLSFSLFLQVGFTFDFIYFRTIREMQQEENQLETKNLQRQGKTY